MKRIIFASLLLINPVMMMTAKAKSIFSYLPSTNSKTVHVDSAQGLDPNVLKLALTAYNCATLSGQNKQNILTIVDYSKPSTEKRLWVFDLQQNKVLFNSLVAHGQGSGNVTPTRFSNEAQTHASSIGLFRTGDVYNGHNGYSLRLYGLEKNFNENAASRAIVVHGADYVNETLARAGRIGRSWGCPAVPRQLATPIINTIKGGSFVFAYYPDATWLQKSNYLHCSANPLYAANAAEKLLENVS